uniref:C2H2-type domain-containing protein n=1 Tax=Arion vulgaris TaxID=1028688 RepID=A0A0B7BCZ9_9EUPU
MKPLMFLWIVLCTYSTSSKSEIIHHVCMLHPEVRVVGSDEDVDKMTPSSEDFQHAEKLSKPFQDCQEEVLIVPDDQVFSEPALCSRCDFTTILRREMVIHLQQNHPEISVMGRNSYPVQVSALGHSVGPMDESCIVGSGSLDARLRCLYENYGTQMKCLICGAERPKKFFIHVHILRHLNIYLWKCAFCTHRGLQKYKMVDHIKKVHAGKPLSARYLRVNVEEKVANFLSQFNVIKNRKANLDEGNFVPFTSMADELSDQASNDSSKSQQKSPVPASGAGSSCPHSLGSDDLDDKISCMYESAESAFFKCRVCYNQFQRKFAIHRHIIISHLKVALLSCAYCGMEGVERHQLVDHILACHKPAPISILTLDIDLKKMAIDFLTKMAAKEHGGGLFDTVYADKSGMMKKGLSSHTASLERSFSQSQSPAIFPGNNKPKYQSLKPSSSLKPASFRFGNKSPSSASVKKASIVDPDVIMLGRDGLDRKLNCLYQERPSGQLRCLVCRWEFPRKYPLHRHIMLRHLKMSLVGCPYCPFEGIEKYNVSTHIKEEHKDKPINIMFTQPDVETRVRQFVDDMATIGGKCQEGLIRKPKSKSRPLMVVPKVEKQSEDEEEEEEEDKEDEGDDDDDDETSSGKQPHGGLVVAMFGKKKQHIDDDFVVKTEVDDEFEAEGSAMFTNNDEDDGEGDYNEDDDPGADKSSYEPSFSSKLSVKYPLENSYIPGSYRSPAGGKAKALDVVTKIKVLKAKEGPIMKFYCEKCNFTSLHRSNIVRHIYKIHEKYQTHTCPMCSYQTLSLMLMEKHIDKTHNSGHDQEDSFNQITEPSTPIMGPLSFQKKKENASSKKSAMKFPIDNSIGAGPKNFACAYCYYETNTQEDILQHTKDNHSQGDYSSPGAKSPASASKTDDRLAACWDGSKKAVKRKMQDEDEVGVFKRKRRFIFEKGNELIRCGHCDIKETSMARMQDHISWDHPGLPFQAKPIPAWRFLCKSCAVKTMATSKMKYHLNRHINYRPYTCVTCGAFFPSPDQCRRHSRSQGHEEQYTYVRNPKKELRVEELLEGTRQLALKVQEEAAKNPDFDISQTESFIAMFQESRGNLKRTLSPGSSKKSKKAARKADGGEDEQSKKLSSKSPQTAGVEQDVTIKCYNCEFTSGNVSNVNIHHKEAHPGKKFLWTELDRGFTCDSTGEALVDCDSVPGTSSDVGYTTRMTLGSGSNTMRFKCKTCDFSSYVIQAMKSHLKSHQPKGFICPYCSRSFSGKEKLMRHQYCLHKGQPLWVIHLRRCGVTGSTSVKKGKGNVAFEDTSISIKEEGIPQTGESDQKETDSTEQCISGTL